MNVWRWRLFVVFAVFALVVLVALTRMYLGVHYLSVAIAAFDEALRTTNVAEKILSQRKKPRFRAGLSGRHYGDDGPWPWAQGCGLACRFPSTRNDVEVADSKPESVGSRRW